MADEQGQQQQQQAQPPAEKKKPLTDVIAEEWSKQIAIPTATAAVVGAGLYYGSQTASNIPKSFGLESVVSGAFGSLGNLGVGAATFGLLTLGLPLLYYPASHILNEGTMEGILTDLKKNYFKHPVEKTILNTISSLVAMDAYSGYTWTSYLATTGASYLTMLLTPFLVVPPIGLIGIGALGLVAGYALAFSRGDINYGRLALSPFVGVIKTAYEAVKGVLNLALEAATAVHDLGYSTHLAMLGAVPAPAGKKR